MRSVRGSTIGEPWMEPIVFAMFGLDREMPEWVTTQTLAPALHLAPGNKIISGAHEIGLPEWNGDSDRLPYDDDAFDAVWCTHFLEHLADPRPCIAEVARVLRVGGVFNIVVPHAQSLIFLQDLDHKTAFVIETWKTLLSNPYYDSTGVGRPIPFRVGVNFTFAVAERNTVLVTQLIKTGDE